MPVEARREWGNTVTTTKCGGSSGAAQGLHVFHRVIQHLTLGQQMPARFWQIIPFQWL